jgi:hypothetical protein
LQRCGQATTSTFSHKVDSELNEGDSTLNFKKEIVMFKKELYVGMLVAVLSLGFAGTALAGEVIFDGSEAGDWEFKFDASDAGASEAVQNHVYDQESLAAVGTEAGNWEYKFNAPETPADIAARNYNYDQESLAVNGTEAGDWEYKSYSSGTKASGSTAHEAVADDSKAKDAVCKRC